LTCHDLLSQELPEWTEANYEKYQLGFPVFVPRCDHWGSRIQSNTAAPPISVTHWGSSVTVVTTPLAIRTLFPVGTLNFLVSTESIPVLGPRRDVELTTLASSARLRMRGCIPPFLHTRFLHVVVLCGLCCSVCT
jgi:hypothetical protein